MAADETLKTRASRLSGFFGLQRSTVGVLGMVILVGMGEHMAERFLPIYMMALGGGVLSIGLLQAMDNLLSALYSFPGGYLSDRIGTKRSLLVFNLVAMAGLPGDPDPRLAGGAGRRGVFHLLVGHITAGHHEPDIQGAAPEQAHHGGEHAFAGTPHPHGARSFDRRALHRHLGRARRGSSRLRGGLCNGRGGVIFAAADDRRRHAGCDILRQMLAA